MKKLIFTLFLAFCIHSMMAQVVITEIMYNPPESGIDSLEFIELFNAGDNAVNLKDYTLTANNVAFLFPGFNLGAGEYVLVAVDSVAFENNFDFPAFQWTGGGLSNSGRRIELVDPSSNVVDVVEYEDRGDWPGAADGGGASLVLCDVNADNNDPLSWRAANTATGIIINGLEIFANPAGASQCPGGPIVSFLNSSVGVGEDVGSINIDLLLEDGDQSMNSIFVSVGFGSSAIMGQDFNFTPQQVDFDSGVERDTQTISLEIIDDMDPELLENITLELMMPSSGLTIDPLNAAYTISITDNDTELANIVITEIMYNPPESGTDSLEYIELLNNGSDPVNMNGFNFTQGFIYTFSDTTIMPGQYISIVKDSAAFRRTFGVTGLQWTDGALTNGGEDIELRDPSGNVIDFVDYRNNTPWDPAANGTGASLELCNVDADNNNPANWQASTTEVGTIINGSALLASPNSSNDCEPPGEVQYPAYSIGTVTTNGVDGNADSVGVRTQLQGVVYGVNLRPNGLQFTIIDGNNDGIHVFSSSNNFGYSVNEEDEVVVQGTITQFNGLTQIAADTVWLNTSGNELFEPTVVASLGEETESQLVKLETLTIVDANEWTNSGSGFNVRVTNGVDTFAMRIDADVDLFGTTPPSVPFNLIGLGGQFDNSSPFDEGYQLLPRYIADIQLISSTVDPALQSFINIYPNPAKSFLIINSSIDFDVIRISNIYGQSLNEILRPNASVELNMDQFSRGTYLLTFVKEDRIWTERVVKQ